MQSFIVQIAIKAPLPHEDLFIDFDPLSSFELDLLLLTFSLLYLFPRFMVQTLNHC
jgi:hypothetical protein